MAFKVYCKNCEKVTAHIENNSCSNCGLIQNEEMELQDDLDLSWHDDSYDERVQYKKNGIYQY